MADDDSCCRCDPCLILECSRMVVKFNLSHTVGDIRNHIVAYPLTPQCLCACMLMFMHACVMVLPVHFFLHKKESIYSLWDLMSSTSSV